LKKNHFDENADENLSAVVGLHFQCRIFKQFNI